MQLDESVKLTKEILELYGQGKASDAIAENLSLSTEHINLVLSRHPATKEGFCGRE